MNNVRRFAYGAIVAVALVASPQTQASDPLTAANETEGQDQGPGLDLGQSFSASAKNSRKTRASVCDSCFLSRTTNIRKLNATERRKYGQWRGEDSLGYSVQMGGMEIGLWGDVREVNNAANADEGIVPTFADPSPGGGIVTGPGLGRPSGSQSSGPGGGLASGGGIGASPSGSGIGGVAPISSRISNTNTSGAELAYREYVAGLFISSRF